MKLIKTKLLQKARGRKIGKYLITLEVTDNDICKFEDFATCHIETKEDKKCINECDFRPEYRKWIKRVWHIFWQLWHKYD